MPTATLPDSLALLSGSAAPLESLALRVSPPVREELEAAAARLTASRAAVTRRVVDLGLAELRQQLAAAGL
jgi:hypothetical protein